MRRSYSLPAPVGALVSPEFDEFGGGEGRDVGFAEVVNLRDHGGERVRVRGGGEGSGGEHIGEVGGWGDAGVTVVVAVGGPVGGGWGEGG